MVERTEILKESLVEAIFLLTTKPITYQRLIGLYPSLGTECTLEEACKQLGYYSLNEFIRQNQRLFKFLTLFVCKNYDGYSDQRNPFLIHYYNNIVGGIPQCRSELLEYEPIGHRRATISFDETIFFEFHNSLDFLDARMRVVRFIDYCQMGNMDNLNGMVPLCKMNQAYLGIHENFDFSTQLKTWFPNMRGTENIVQKILFEDIDYSLSDGTKKKEIEFNLKEGWDLKSTESKLEELKMKLEQIQERLERDTYMRSREETADPFKQTFSRDTQKILSMSSSKKRKGIFGTSDDEDDFRLENPKPEEGLPKDIDSHAFVESEAVDIKEEEESKVVVKDEPLKLPIFAQKYGLFDDVDLNDIYI